MRVLSLYISRLFLARFALLLFGLLAVFLSFELMERGDNVLNATNDDLWSLPRYALLRLPDFASQLLPVATLLAAILTIGELTRHHELEVIWTTGTSPARILTGLLPLTSLLVVAQFAIDNWAIPPAMNELRSLGIDRYESRALGNDKGAVWLRSGADLLRIPSGGARDGRLHDITLFRRDENGILMEQLTAETGDPEGEGWLLRDVRRTSATTQARRRIAEVYWDGRLDLVQLARLAVEPGELSLGELGQMIDNEAYGQRSSVVYRTWRHYRLASASAPLLMVCLVMSLTLFLSARSAFGWVFLAAMALSSLYLVVGRAILAMGEMALLPPWLAGWGPPLILLSLSGSLMIYRESARRSPTRKATP